MHRAQPRSRQALLLSTPQETDCGPALLQLSARAQVPGPRCYAAAPKLNSLFFWSPSAFASHCTSASPEPSCREFLNVLTHVLPTDGATSSNP
ncbi:hypothetical protein IG631_20687 [Alternaria alternata]|nr:hypothetical protein IG631_20687 [Alternaria alternata]